MRSLLLALSFSVFSFTAQSSLMEANIVDNFANGEFIDVPGQNKGHYEVRDSGGGILHLGSEAWTYISTESLFGLDSFVLDDKTRYTLNFDMRVKQGNNSPAIPSEIGGIMLANDNVENIGGDDGVYALNLSGSQSWGSKAFRYDFDSLNNGRPTWQRFNVDLNDVFNGDYQYLVFINDCDGDSCSNSTQFRDISVRVQVPEPYTVSLFALSFVGLASLRLKKKRHFQA
ncbi:PEP-CTERM domain protein [Salinimonas chungwhensis]|uniref:PEP-CTERM domain protein n=1 Tax=Salinimonas chungwhensis TaxID=265425 RepID=UPI00036039E5|nr:PEP-CTERM domain protein [Salinimonas chungwhensis]